MKEPANIFDRTPPHSHEAESALLGALLLDGPGQMPHVMQVMRGAGDFYLTKHAAIYEAISHVYRQHERVDIVQVKQRLADRKQLDDVGGVEYLLRLGEAVPDAGNAPYYAGIIIEKARMRDLIDAMCTGMYQAYEGQATSAEIAERIEAKIFSTVRAEPAKQGRKLVDIMQDVYDELAALEEGDVKGLPTGFWDLDAMLSAGGFEPGQFIIIGARPGVGKSALALSIAENMTQGRSRAPVALLSLEMSEREVGRRSMASLSRVGAYDRRPNEEQYGAMQRAIATVAEAAPLFVYDRTDWTLSLLRAEVRRLVSREGIRAMFLDYLQLMPSDRANSRQEAVAEVSRTLKLMAKEFEIPIIALSQLNRNAEARENKRPALADLRESGTLEQDADCVMLAWRPELQHADDPEWAANNPDKQGLTELILVKQRSGRPGIVRLHFDGELTRFQNRAPGGRW